MTEGAFEDEAHIRQRDAMCDEKGVSWNAMDGAEHDRRALLRIIDNLRRLPVLQTCEYCRHCHHWSDAGLPHPSCQHPKTRGQPVEEHSAPPDWCPLRGKP
jgi:hypothetical protein